MTVGVLNLEGLGGILCGIFNLNYSGKSKDWVGGGLTPVRDPRKHD